MDLLNAPVLDWDDLKMLRLRPGTLRSYLGGLGDRPLFPKVHKSEYPIQLKPEK